MSKFMVIKTCKILLTLFAFALSVCPWTHLKSAEPELSSKINPYSKLVENPEAKIKQFQNDFTQALKNPSQIQTLGNVYTNGFRNDLGYTEFGPSFVAFVDLHQALYQYMEKRKDLQDPAIPPTIYNDFKAASEKFISQVFELGSIKDIEAYEDRLNALYNDFLVQFMKKHQKFFKEYFLHGLNTFKGIHGAKLDTIDCAFFALQEGWPGYESNDRKYQFEQLYAWRMDNGHNVVILGYNDRQYACDKDLHIYLWDTKKPSSIPTQIKHENMKFDLSPGLRYGGCSYPADVPWVINFDGDSGILRFYGYDNTIFKYYMYNVKTNQWKITQIPGTDSK